MTVKIIATNRKAAHEYTLSDRWEAGLVLYGTEVKSLRQSKVNFSDAWVDLRDGEAFIVDLQISPYEFGNRMNHLEKRQRKLLLSKKEIAKITQATHERGYTCIPTKIYFKNQWAKVEISLAKGKKDYDKREAKKKKEADREIERGLNFSSNEFAHNCKFALVWRLSS